MMLPRQSRLLTASLFFLVVGLLITPEVWTGGLPWGEGMEKHVPVRYESARLLRAGRLPMFTDRIFGGMPVYSQWWPGCLYLPNALYLLADPLRAAGLLEALHAALGGLGMMLYLRSRRLVDVSAFAGGALFACGTFFVLHAGHVPLHEAGCLAPWVVWLGRRAFRRPDGRRLVCLTAAGALQLSAGSGAMFLYTAVWLLADWACSVRLRLSQATRSLWVLCALLLAIPVLAIQIVPYLRHVAQSSLPSSPPEYWMEYHLPISQIVAWASPQFLGIPPSRWMGPDKSWEYYMTIFTGGWVLAVVALGLSVSVPRFRRSVRARMVWVYGVLLSVSLLVSLGEGFPPGAWVLAQLPAGNAQIPARVLFLTTTAACVLAACGIQWLLRMRGGARFFVYVVGWFVLTVVCLDTFLLTESMVPGDVPLSAGLVLVLLFDQPWEIVSHGLVLLAGACIATSRFFPRFAGWALLAVIVGDGLIISSGMTAEVERQTPFTQYERHPLLSSVRKDAVGRLHTVSLLAVDPDPLAVRGNTGMLLGIRTLGGQSELLRHSFQQAVQMGGDGLRWGDGRSLRDPYLLQILGVSHVLWDEVELEVMGVRPSGFDVVSRWGDLALARIAGARPRFDFAPSWRAGEDLPAVLEENRVMAFPPGQRPVLVEEARLRRYPPQNRVLGDAHLEVLGDDGGRQVVRARSAEGAVLVVRDAYWPGWMYRIDDESSHDVARAQGLIRAVPVPAGEHTVTMWYRTPGLGAGALISGLSLVLLGALGLLPGVIRARAGT